MKKEEEKKNCIRFECNDWFLRKYVEILYYTSNLMCSKHVFFSFFSFSVVLFFDSYELIHPAFLLGAQSYKKVRRDKAVGIITSSSIAL